MIKKKLYKRFYEDPYPSDMFTMLSNNHIYMHRDIQNVVRSIKSQDNISDEERDAGYFINNLMKRMQIPWYTRWPMYTVPTVKI